jgi:hypothetical protein
MEAGASPAPDVERATPSLTAAKAAPGVERAAPAAKAAPDVERGGAAPEAKAAPDEEEGQQDTYATPKLPMDGMSDCFFISSLAIFIFGSFALALTFAMLIIHGLIDPIMDEYTKTHNITRGASTDQFFDLRHLGSNGMEHNRH